LIWFVWSGGLALISEKSAILGLEGDAF
jgi:hypothetical protein